MPLNVGTIYSTLGNSNSLIPLAVKDFAATGGMTAGSYVTGKEEGFDRFIDEIGTEFIWLFGIPLFKKLFDLVGFKAAKMDSKFDARNLKNKDIFNKIKEYAPTEEIKKDIEKIGKKQKLFKGLVMSKFVVSTALTVGTYIGLTKFKQNYTAKKIRQNLIDEYNAKKNEEENKKNSNNPAFKGLGSAIEGFVFSPVKNMWILDGCITGERLKDSRTPQEFVGYGIKEASTLCFMYYAGGKIQELAEKHAKKKYNKTIGIDARIIEDGSLKKVFDDGSIEKSLNKFSAVKGKPLDIYEFLHKNPDNFIVKSAKKSDIIKMYKDTNKIDTRKYIDLQEVESLNNKLSELYSQYKKALKNGETSEQFFKGVKKLKRSSIRLNIGSCIFALGVMTPAMMLLKRFTDKDGAEFRTKDEIRKQLIKEGIIS